MADRSCFRSVWNPALAAAWDARINLWGWTSVAASSLTFAISLFDRAGTLLSTGPWEGVTVRYGTSGSAGSVGPYSMRADGLFRSEITTFSLRIGGTPSQDSVRVPEVLFDASGNVVDTVGWDIRPPPALSEMERVRVGSRGYTVPQPPSGNVPRLDSPAGEWAVERTPAQADSMSSFRVWRFGLSGDTVFSRAFRYMPRRYTNVVLDSIALGGVSGRLSEGETDAVRVSIRDAMEFPEFQPPVLEGIAGADGSLWLRREDTGEPTNRWLVIEADGTPRGHVSILRPSRVRWVSERGFVAVEADEFGVPWIVRFRLDEEVP